LALAFGAPPTIGSPMLSPDGTRLLFIQQNPQGVSMLRSLDVSNGDIVTLLQGTVGGYDIRWCAFASETRVLCDLRQDIYEKNPDHQQLVTVDLDGANLLAVHQLADCRGGYDYLSDLPPMDRLADDEEQIMLLCEGHALLLDIDTGGITEVSEAGAGEVGSRYKGTMICVVIPRITTCGYGGTIPASPGTLKRRQRLVSNGHGFPELYRGTQGNLDRWFIRDELGTPWQPLLETNPLAFDTPFRPVGYGADLDHVFNIDWDRDTGSWGLYRKDLTGDRENQPVFSRPDIDIELVDTMGRHNRVVAAAFLDGRSRRAIVDARIAEVYAYVSALLPELDVEILDESWNRERYLARVRGPASAGEWLLVDMANEVVQTLGPEYDHLTGYPLAATRLVEIESSTGDPFTAHLTLPHAMTWPEPASPVPAVVIPRGRPTHEDVADPHYLVQFLAANGYAVLRVNNRVDDAVGRGWLPDRAIVGWRQSAADVADAAEFLIRQGVSAPGRICAAGKDYGAHTALMTAIEAPDRFSCLISIAGVTDPLATPDGEVFMSAELGGGSDTINQASPVHRAAELDVPLLMFHGASDTEVSLDAHAVTLSSRLERAGKDVVLIEYPDAAHDIGRGPDRIDMLTRIRGFLAEHIGPEVTEVEAADGAIPWRLER
jgi:alpha-beta hydrolase superfamily lysophospholipase